MSAEKRSEYRYTLALDTEVHFREQFVEGMFRCRTRDIGLGGIFLPSDALPIVKKTDIELLFLVQSQPLLQPHRVRAEVVRINGEGAALSFSGLTDAQRKKLRRFLLRAKITPGIEDPPQQHDHN
ncbi:MAG: PilZ domain-containing protein [Gammaproteobacteria bacterium]|nr:PilZ domain-containing protein [Gammaproteobacteria bacterium]